MTIAEKPGVSMSDLDIRQVRPEPHPGSVAAASIVQQDVRYHTAASADRDATASLGQEARQAVARLVHQLNDFTSLPADWDSYGGLPLDPAVALRALQVLLPIVTLGVPMPALIPRSAGGLSLEWHAATGRELILSFEDSKTVTTYLWDPQTDEEWERSGIDGRFVAELARMPG